MAEFHCVTYARPRLHRRRRLESVGTRGVTPVGHPQERACAASDDSPDLASGGLDHCVAHLTLLERSINRKPVATDKHAAPARDRPTARAVPARLVDIAPAEWSWVERQVGRESSMSTPPA